MNARQERVKELCERFPGITAYRLVAVTGEPMRTIYRDMRQLHIGLPPAVSCWRKAFWQEIVPHEGTWCVVCECGEYVPITDEQDSCPQCGLLYRVHVEVYSPEETDE